jgi:SAM-dependent methyltransferase
VERARAKALAAGVDGDLDVADAMTPPWRGRAFDVVLARHVIWALADAGLGRWIELLKPDGRLVLIEGRWWTGEGLTSQETLRLVRAHNRDAVITPLDDPIYWGGPVTDERYLLVSPPVSSP